MFKPFAKVVKGIDKLSDVAKSLEEIERQSVMVGIPEQRASRGSEEVNNAELGYVLAHGVRRGEVRRFVKDAQKQGQTYSEAMQAYIMAHGDPLWHIPPRPFLEPAIEHNKENLGTQQGKVLKKALEGKRDQAKTELGKLGMYSKRIVQEWFTNSANNWPPNAPATIKRKGSDRPMVDTGKLYAAIDYVIRGNDGQS
jgi:hypothetical protein